MRQLLALLFFTSSSAVAFAFAPRCQTATSFGVPTTKPLILHAVATDKGSAKKVSPWSKPKNTIAASLSSDSNAKEIVPSSTDDPAKSKSRTVDNLIATADRLIHNFLAAGGGDDPIGTRGEGFFYMQAALIVSIALGGVPMLSNYLSLLAGPGLLVVGVAVLVLTAMDMGESITPWPKPNGQGLVQDGLYGQMRHPMYFGLLATMVGFSIATESIQRLLLTLVLCVAIDIKSDYEEEELKKAYPEYEEYKKKVPSKFVPKGLMDSWKKKERE